MTHVSFYKEATGDVLATVDDLDRLLEFELGSKNGAKTATDAGLARLARLRSLRIVRIGGEQITDPGLVHLAALSGLQKLDLRDAPCITDAGMAHIAKMTELRRVTPPHRTRDPGA